MSKKNEMDTLFSRRLNVPLDMAPSVRLRTHLMYQIWFKKMMPDMRRWPQSVHDAIFARRSAGGISIKNFFGIAVFLLGNGIGPDAIREWFYLREGLDVASDISDIMSQLTTFSRNWFFKNYEKNVFESFPKKTIRELAAGLRFGARLPKSFLKELTSNRPKLKRSQRVYSGIPLPRKSKATAWVNRRAVVGELKTRFAGVPLPRRSVASTWVNRRATVRELKTRFAGVPLPRPNPIAKTWANRRATMAELNARLAGMGRVRPVVTPGAVAKTWSARRATMKELKRAARPPQEIGILTNVEKAAFLARIERDKADRAARSKALTLAAKQDTLAKDIVAISQKEDLTGRRDRLFFQLQKKHPTWDASLIEDFIDVNIYPTYRKVKAVFDKDMKLGYYSKFNPVAPDRGTPYKRERDIHDLLPSSGLARTDARLPGYADYMNRYFQARITPDEVALTQRRLSGYPFGYSSSTFSPLLKDDYANRIANRWRKSNVKKRVVDDISAAVREDIRDTNAGKIYRLGNSGLTHRSLAFRPKYKYDRDYNLPDLLLNDPSGYSSMDAINMGNYLSQSLAYHNVNKRHKALYRKGVGYDYSPVFAGIPLPVKSNVRNGPRPFDLGAATARSAGMGAARMYAGIPLPGSRSVVAGRRPDFASLNARLAGMGRAQRASPVARSAPFAPMSQALSHVYSDVANTSLADQLADAEVSAINESVVVRQAPRPRSTTPVPRSSDRTAVPNPYRVYPSSAVGGLRNLTPNAVSGLLSEYGVDPVAGLAALSVRPNAAPAYVPWADRIRRLSPMDASSPMDYVDFNPTGPFQRARDIFPVSDNVDPRFVSSPVASRTRSKRRPRWRQAARLRRMA